jgi:uncharacterized membrane protein YGL010W
MPSDQRVSRAARRCDALIASTILVALIAGWIVDFVGPKQFALRLDSLLAATVHWT